MARRVARPSSRHLDRDHHFRGRKGFREFMKLRCTVTGHRKDVVRRRDLYRAYQKFCAATRQTVASIVNVGRYLAGLQVRASTRLGGSNGRKQEYAYVGLCLLDQADEAPEAVVKELPPPQPLLPSLPDPLASPSSQLPLSTSMDGHPEGKDASFPSSSTPGTSRPRSSEDSLLLLDSFLREHVEYTGSAEDAVAVAELHAAYRKLCRTRGVAPPSSARLSNHLTRQEGVIISQLSFEIVKRAYQGLRWTSTAIDALTPSRRPRHMPCISCEALRCTPAAAAAEVPMKREMERKEEGVGDGRSPWVRDDCLGEQLSFRYWGEEDSIDLLDSLETAPPPPPPTPTSPPSLPDTSTPDLLFQGAADLAHLLEAFADTDSCVF